MATYVYRCAGHGEFDVRRGLGQAATSEVCPHCGAASRRVFTAPALGRLDAGLVRSYAAAASTAENPAVVTSLPRRPSWNGPGIPPALHPAVAKLPRP